MYQPDDTVNVIDLLLVTDLEMRPATNGSRKRTEKLTLRTTLQVLGRDG